MFRRLVLLILILLSAIKCVQSQQPKGDDDIEVWKVLRAYRTTASEVATSTTPAFRRCHCDLIPQSKLYSLLLESDKTGFHSIPYYKRLELLQMGLYTHEQAKRCYDYCRLRTPTHPSYSHISREREGQRASSMSPSLLSERTIASEEATTTTPDLNTCQCDLIPPSKLYRLFLESDRNGFESMPYYKRLELLQMGLYTLEQAKRCYHVCRNLTPTHPSYSQASDIMPTTERDRNRDGSGRSKCN